MKKILNLVAVTGIAGIMLMIGACGQTGKESIGESSQASGTKVLKVAMECSYAPYNWSQPDNSNGAIKISNGQNEYLRRLGVPDRVGGTRDLCVNAA